ncbi:serpentine type 7TM GPCR chemoreceptor srt domain-containing protein [Ditylenchus destructor]|nr:serpentine type 7TM GPCR chemoreceptor srt domain-containing protein [Ditylenchus destructor]
MEMFFFRPDEYERLYNCTTYRVEDVPLEKRQHTYLGIAFLVLFVIFMMLYIPCVIACYRRTKQVCYKFLFFIGIIDIACLPVCGFVTGYMAIEGAVFCSHPTFLYFCGVFGNFCWVTESTTAIILALNRCIEMISPKLSEELFRENRTWCWMCLATLYGFCFVAFTKPVMFNGILCAWFFNPHTGYIEDIDGLYSNHPHTFHNYFVCLALTGSYLMFIVIFVVKSSMLDNIPAGRPTGSKGAAQRTAFIQVAVLSCVNAVGSGIYDYMQFFPIGQIFILVASYAWLFIHGIPSVIFVTMNKTIRADCIKMCNNLLGICIRRKIIPYTTTHMSTHTSDNKHHISHQTKTQHDKSVTGKNSIAHAGGNNP